MAHYWILLFSWFGFASPQYINTLGPGAELVLDPLDSSIQYPPLQYIDNFNLPPTRDDYETIKNTEPHEPNNFYRQDSEQAEVPRKRRTVDVNTDVKEKNLVDKEYIPNIERTRPFFIGLSSPSKNNSTEFKTIEKRSFSPWGGKRADIIENMWTWKRAPAIREPSMPKRVRFSPWGGKRSGQMVYKPETKASRIIFSASVPELTRIVSNYPSGGEKINIAGIRFIPSMDKRHPIKVLALGAQMDARNIKDAMPFKTFLESMPKMYKPGHTYANVNLKNDGKRKVKFSAWGGKRSPPIIGPIWTPTAQDVKESTLDTIVLIRNSKDFEDLQKTI